MLFTLPWKLLAPWAIVAALLRAVVTGEVAAMQAFEPTCLALTNPRYWALLTGFVGTSQAPLPALASLPRLANEVPPTSFRCRVTRRADSQPVTVLLTTPLKLLPSGTPIAIVLVVGRAVTVVEVAALHLSPPLRFLTVTWARYCAPAIGTELTFQSPLLALWSLPALTKLAEPGFFRFRITVRLVLQAPTGEFTLPPKALPVGP